MYIIILENRRCIPEMKFDEEKNNWTYMCFDKIKKLFIITVRNGIFLLLPHSKFALVHTHILLHEMKWSFILLAFLNGSSFRSTFSIVLFFHDFFIYSIKTCQKCIFELDGYTYFISPVSSQFQCFEWFSLNAHWWYNFQFEIWVGKHYDRYYFDAFWLFSENGFTKDNKNAPFERDG